MVYPKVLLIDVEFDRIKNAKNIEDSNISFELVVDNN